MITIKEQIYTMTKHVTACIAGHSKTIAGNIHLRIHRNKARVDSHNALIGHKAYRRSVACRYISRSMRVDFTRITLIAIGRITLIAMPLRIIFVSGSTTV